MRDEAAVSYTWVLERFEDLLWGVQTPNVIVIHRDERLSLAIRDAFQVFSNLYQILICYFIWYIY